MRKNKLILLGEKNAVLGTPSGDVLLAARVDDRGRAARGDARDDGRGATTARDDSDEETIIFFCPCLLVLDRRERAR